MDMTTLNRKRAMDVVEWACDEMMKATGRYADFDGFVRRVMDERVRDSLNVSEDDAGRPECLSEDRRFALALNYTLEAAKDMHALLHLGADDVPVPWATAVEISYLARGLVWGRYASDPILTRDMFKLSDVDQYLGSLAK